MHRISVQNQKRFLSLVALVVSLASLLFIFRQSHLRRQEEALEQQQRLLQDQEQQQREEQQRHDAWVDSRRTVHEPVLKSYDSVWTTLLQTHDIAFPSILPAWTDSDNDLLRMAIGEGLRANLFTTQEEKIDFRQLTTQLRLFKMLYQYFDPLLAADINVQQNASHQEAWSLYTKLETQLFPWLSPTWKSAFDINGKYDEARPRGIVMCVGNGQYHYALRAITAVRRTLKSKLPIEIFAIDDGDLSPAKREVLREFENVRIFNVMDIVGKEGTEFGGWALKPYAMVASSFKEVILMDADVYFLRAPESVFDDEGYKATGALFFYDRTLFGGWRIGRDWLSSFLPSMSSLVKHTRWWRLQSAHEQESGIVVIDKSRALLGLMATCKMNGKRERDEVSYEHIHGDKETFWVGFEMMQTPYAFVKSHAAVLGALGDAGDENTVCGNIMHLDAQGKPYWWNGAIYRDKNRWHDRYMKFESYAIGESWEFETSCIKETDQIHTLSDEFKKIGQQYIKNDQDLKSFDGVD